MKAFFKFARTIGYAAAMLACVAGVAKAQDSTSSSASAMPDQLHIGDRIALTIEGPFQFADTVVVRDGYVLRLAQLGDIKVAGVRRKDTQKYLATEIGKYVKDATVHATPLVRLSVLGQVGRPGYYTMPSDILLSDVVMRAGGPGADANLNKTVVRRGGAAYISADSATKALAGGETLDDLRVAPGDEIVVGANSHVNFLTVMQYVGVIVPLISLLVYLKH